MYYLTSLDTVDIPVRRTLSFSFVANKSMILTLLFKLFSFIKTPR